jgi:hypothetical protein
MVIHYDKYLIITYMLRIIKSSEDLDLVCPYLYWLGWKLCRGVGRSLQSIIHMICGKLSDDYME